MSDVHPIYAETKPERQWKGLVQGLWSKLNQEVERSPGTWCWRIIPNGMVVALERIPRVAVARYDFRLARRSVAGQPETDDEWNRDLGIVLRALEIIVTNGDRAAPVAFACWTQVEEIKEKWRRVLRIRSLLHGEVRAGVAHCWACKEEGTTTDVDWFPSGGVRGQRCFDHAMGRKNDDG